MPESFFRCRDNVIKTFYTEDKYSKACFEDVYVKCSETQ